MVYLANCNNGLKVIKVIDLKNTCLRTFYRQNVIYLLVYPRVLFQDLYFFKFMLMMLLKICFHYVDYLLKTIHFSNLRMTCLILNINSIMIYKCQKHGQISGCLNSTHLRLKLFTFQGKLVLLHKRYFFKAISWSVFPFIAIQVYYCHTTLVGLSIFLPQWKKLIKN